MEDYTLWEDHYIKAYEAYDKGLLDVALPYFLSAASYDTNEERKATAWEFIRSIFHEPVKEGLKQNFSINSKTLANTGYSPEFIENSVYAGTEAVVAVYNGRYIPISLRIFDEGDVPPGLDPSILFSGYVLDCDADLVSNVNYLTENYEGMDIYLIDRDKCTLNFCMQAAELPELNSVRKVFGSIGECMDYFIAHPDEVMPVPAFSSDLAFISDYKEERANAQKLRGGGNNTIAGILYEAAGKALSDNKEEESLNIFLLANQYDEDPVSKEREWANIMERFYLPFEAERRECFRYNSRLMRHLNLFMEFEPDKVCTCGESAYVRYANDTVKISNTYYSEENVPETLKADYTFAGFVLDCDFDLIPNLHYLRNNSSDLKVYLIVRDKSVLNYCMQSMKVNSFEAVTEVFDDIDACIKYFEDNPKLSIPVLHHSSNRDFVKEYQSKREILHKKRITGEKDRSLLKLSIVIPSYNRGGVCLKNVRHLLNIPFDNEVEFVISINEAVEIEYVLYDKILEINDNRLVVKKHDEHLEYHMSITKAISLCNCNFALFCSDEDLLRIDNLGHYIDRVIKNPGVGLFLGNTERQIYSEEEQYLRAGEEALTDAGTFHYYLTGAIYNRRLMKKLDVLETTMKLVDAGNRYAGVYPHVVWDILLTLRYDLIVIDKTVCTDGKERRMLDDQTMKSMDDSSLDAVLSISNLRAFHLYDKPLYGKRAQFLGFNAILTIINKELRNPEFTYLMFIKNLLTTSMGILKVKLLFTYNDIPVKPMIDDLFQLAREEWANLARDCGIFYEKEKIENAIELYYQEAIELLPPPDWKENFIERMKAASIKIN